MNIPGSDLSSGDVIFTYNGPGPPQGSNLHRYIFLLFTQPSGNVEYNSSLVRSQTSTRDLISDYNLELVAGDFFQAEFEVRNVINNKFIGEEIVPDIFDQEHMPAAMKPLIISYGSGLVVGLGNELTPSQVREAPTVEWEANDDAYFTLLMTGE